MIYTLGRLFFPSLVHQEKKLRARMQWVAIVSGLVLVAGISVLLFFVQQSRLQKPAPGKPFKILPPQLAR